MKKKGFDFRVFGRELVAEKKWRRKREELFFALVCWICVSFGHVKMSLLTFFFKVFVWSVKYFNFIL